MSFRHFAIWCRKEYILKAFINGILDCIFPPHCPVCGKVVSFQDGRICFSCRKVLKYVQEPRCMKCGKAITGEEKEFCWDCSKKEFSYIRGFSVWEYDENMRKSIAAFKYHQRAEYRFYYGEQIEERFGDRLRSLRLDALIPVPLHRRKLNSRGYNQAELIAKQVSQKLQVPVCSKLLVRTKYTRPQKELDDTDRWNNLKTAFSIRKKEAERLRKNGIFPERVLLVDDIYTTGSTMEACTRTLMQAGVKEVYLLSLSIGRGK